MKNAISYILLIGLAVAMVLLVRHGLQSSSSTDTGDGGPYTAIVEPRVHGNVHGKRVFFALTVEDDRGRRCRTIRLPSGQQSPPPKVVVRNADDEVVYSNRFKYG
ncbi:MAG: hypothetical protein GVY16_12380 [Planctomycetes bacterium]|jgi:hypothetical protein|nr:hypothetical protein [Phycisphaerae bacterium]NBB96517.1 hypothetical protein [Planctomycetota bacterium]